jgi:TonB family protein
MSLKVGVNAAVVTLVAALAGPAWAQHGSDVELAKGIRQVRDRHLDDAVATLNGVVQRLSPARERKDDLAQAYLWLGIAYADLGLEKSGRANFREALKIDPRVSAAGAWPPKAERLFAAVKAEAIRSVSAVSSVSSLSPEANAVYDRAQALIKSGRLDEAEAASRDWIARNPKSAAGEQTIASMYWDRAYRDPQLTDEQKDGYADLGLGHVNRALQINPNLIDAVIYKGLLLRIKAMVAKDAGRRAAYLEEAGQLQKQGLDLRQSGTGEWSGGRLPPPPPPPPPPRPPSPPATVSGRVASGVVGGVAGGVVGGVPGATPVRVGGAIKEPRKLKHVNPDYPGIAQSARVQGVVIMECTIGPEGKVTDVKVLRGIPLLDAAAVEAVRQWEYTPTLLNGVPVPVIMTVTVNFRLGDPSPAAEKP